MLVLSAKLVTDIGITLLLQIKSCGKNLLHPGCLFLLKKADETPQMFRGIGIEFFESRIADSGGLFHFIVGIIEQSDKVSTNFLTCI